MSERDECSREIVNFSSALAIGEKTEFSVARDREISGFYDRSKRNGVRRDEGGMIRKISCTRSVFIYSHENVSADELEAPWRDSR